MLQQSSNITAAQREARRLEGGRLLRTTTLSKAEIARRLGVTRSAVTQWAKQLQKRRNGLNALRRRPHTGRPPRLTAANWRRLLVLLRRSARAEGFNTDRWTLSHIQQLILREYGISYSKSYLSDKLYDLNWNVDDPIPRNRLNQHYHPPRNHNPYKRNFWGQLDSLSYFIP
jgi:transposase